MTRIQAALAVLVLLRREKQPPLIRYTLLLALAEQHPLPMTGIQLCDATRDNAIQSGSLDTMVESGLFLRHQDGKRARSYTLTPLGEAEAARIASGREKPQAATQPHIARSNSALQ